MSDVGGDGRRTGRWLAAVPLVATVLPLATWPGLVAPFSTPKLWLLAGAVMILLPLSAWRAIRLRAPRQTGAALNGSRPGRDDPPFETTTGSLSIEAESSPGSYAFMMQAGNAGTAAAEMEQLANKVMTLANAGDVSSPAFVAAQKKMEAAQDRMMKEMEAQIKDPAAAQKKQDDFGCGTINVWITKGQIAGSVNCGKNVGSSLDLKGK